MPTPIQEQALPGANVPTGAAISPAGQPGPTGVGGATGATGATGPAGPSAVSTDVGNLAVLGSDSLISVPPTGIGPITYNTASWTCPTAGNSVIITITPTTWVQVGMRLYVVGFGLFTVGGVTSSTSITLSNIPVTPGNAASGTVPVGTAIHLVDYPPGFTNRYYYKTHCDHALAAYDANAVSGTGAAITTGLDGTTSHYGVWQLASGTVANNYAWVGSNAVADIKKTNFTKLGFRTVFHNPTPTIPSGAVGATTYAMFYAGLIDSIVTPTNGVFFYFAPAVSANWQLACLNASTFTYVNTTIVAGVNAWYDLAFYWGSSGIQVRADVWSSFNYPTLLAGGPFNTGLPGIGTALMWAVGVKNGTAGTTNYTPWLDLVEIAIEGNANTMNFRGEQLVTAF